MHWTRLLSLFTLLCLIVIALAACGGAPQAATTTSAPAAATSAATAAPALTAVPIPTTSTASTAQESTFTDHPDSTTQARLRLAYFIFSGPNVDLFVNDAVAVNGGQAQTNMPGGYVNGYLYLAPGTYRVAVVPTGKGLDQALGGSLELPLVAGHRYTLAMMGQLQDQSVKPLLIDETAAEMKIGAKPTDSVRILVNNLAGATGLDAEWGGKLISKNIPYGGFDAGIYPGGNASIKVAVSDDPAHFLINDRVDWSEPGATFLLGFAGKYPGSGGVDWGTFNAPVTSELNIIDCLQGFSGKNLSTHGALTSFDTFLAAIKTAGLTEELARSGPHLVLAPTDQAFAALPKQQLDALMADPKALGDLVRNHIVAGYVPRGSLAKTPGGSFDRTFTNLLGAKLTIGDGFAINGINVGDFESYFFADGSQVHPIRKLLLPEPTGTAAASPTATASDVPTSTAEIILTGHTSRVTQASFAPDGKTVVTSSDDGTARLWDAATGKELRQFIGHTHELRGTIFSPDGRTVFTTSNDQTARLWDVASGKELRQFVGHADTVNKAAFSPDGKLVVTASEDGTARVWEVDTGKSVVTFTGHTASAPNRPAFAPDGKAIVTGGLDGNVLMWEPLTGTILKTFKGHTGPVGTPAFSPDGKYLVTPSDDGIALLWDVASAKELRRFEVPGVVIAGAAFSPDGKYLATSGFDGIARLWDAPTGKELRRFVGHADRQGTAPVCRPRRRSADGSLLTGRQLHSHR